MLAAMLLPFKGVATALDGPLWNWGSPREMPKQWMNTLRRRLIGLKSIKRRFRIVCETRGVAESWKAIGATNVSVIPYGLEDTDATMDRATARRRLGLPPNIPILLLFGFHRPDQDYSTVVKAALRLEPHPVLLFVGQCFPGVDPAGLCQTMRYSSHVVIDDFVPRQDIPVYFNAADAVLLPYPRDFQRGSGVVVEACAFECPLIVTEGAYLEHFVCSNGVGLTYSAGDPESLRHAITAILSSELQDSIRLRMRIVAVEHSSTAIGQKYRAVFSDLFDAL
jgi:glycosyltransferase involved in cell wall biosynthesis